MPLEPADLQRFRDLCAAEAAASPAGSRKSVLLALVMGCEALGAVDREAEAQREAPFCIYCEQPTQAISDTWFRCVRGHSFSKTMTAPTVLADGA